MRWLFAMTVLSIFLFIAWPTLVVYGRRLVKYIDEPLQAQRHDKSKGEDS